MAEQAAHLRRTRQAVLDCLDVLDTLPSLPHVVSDMLRLIADEDYAMEDLMSLVQQDPTLTARVLRLANSAHYGRQKEIDSLQEALILLGGAEIHRLVTTTSVMRSLSGGFGADRVLDQIDFWSHSLGTAELARGIANAFRLQFRGADFTAGLLHDVGKVVLDQYFHPEFRECLEVVEHQGLPLFEAERKVLGIDHAEAGYFLATRWGLPENLRTVMRDHHAFMPDHPNAVLTSCVRLADVLVKEGDMACLGERSPWDAVLDPAWGLLCRTAGQQGRDAHEEILAKVRASVLDVRGQVRAMVGELSA
jgi:putative nucleotidyltransferase with HDIG domain